MDKDLNELKEMLKSDTGEVFQEYFDFDIGDEEIVLKLKESKTKECSVTHMSIMSMPASFEHKKGELAMLYHENKEDTYIKNTKEVMEHLMILAINLKGGPEW